MTKFLVLFKISRPHLWIYTIGSFVLGCVYNITDFNKITSIEIVYLVSFLFFFTFPANLLIYGVNDIYDTETDSINPRKESYETTLATERKHLLKLTIIGFSLLFVLFSLFISKNIFSLSIIFVYASFFYSAWPIRAKARPFFDSFFSGIIYTIPTLFGFYLVEGDMTKIPYIAIVVSMCFWIATHAYRAIIDIGSDTEARINTIATVLGKKKTLVFSGFFYLLASILGFFLVGPISFLIFLFYFIFLFYSSIVETYDELFYLYTKLPMLYFFCICIVVLYISFLN